MFGSTQFGSSSFGGNFEAAIDSNPVPIIPVVTGITATPSSLTLNGNTSQSITIVVQGNNNPSQAFTSFKVNGVGSINGASITGVARNTNIQQGTFRFTSVEDEDFYVDVVLTIPALSQTGDTVKPIMVGSITSSNISKSGFNLSIPAATDNVAIKEYKWRLNNGPEISTGLIRNKVYTGLIDNTSYDISVLAYDTSDNPALTPLSINVTTLENVVQPGDLIIANGNLLLMNPDGSIANPEISNFRQYNHQYVIDKDPDSSILYGVEMEHYLNRAGNGITIDSVLAVVSNAELVTPARIQGTVLVAGVGNVVWVDEFNASCTFRFTLSNGDVDDFSIVFRVLDF